MAGTMEDVKLVAHGGLGTNAYFSEGAGAGKITVGSGNGKYVWVFDAVGRPLGFMQLVDAVFNEVAPDSIAGLELWLKADSIEGDDDQKIATWANSAATGSANYAQQSEDDNKPTLKTGANGLNGLPVLHFDAAGSAVSDFMLATFDPGSVGLTVFLVYRTGASVAADPAILGSGGEDPDFVNPTSGIRWGFACGNDTGFGAGWGGADSSVQFGSVGGIATNTPLFARYRFNGSRWDIDGPNANTPADGSFPTSSRFQCYIGCEGVQTNGHQAFPFLGDIAEVIVYKRAISDVECEQVKTYLKNKWGL